MRKTSQATCMMTRRERAQSTETGHLPQQRRGPTTDERRGGRWFRVLCAVPPRLSAILLCMMYDIDMFYFQKYRRKNRAGKTGIRKPKTALSKDPIAGGAATTVHHRSQANIEYAVVCSFYLSLVASCSLLVASFEVDRASFKMDIFAYTCPKIRRPATRPFDDPKPKVRATPS